MNKKVNTVLVLVFSSFIMGLYAQCPESEYKDCRFDPAIETKHYTVEDPNYQPPPPPPPNPEEVRRIYFIHGLGGSVVSWSKAADACKYGALNFPARKCEPWSVDYTNNVGSLRIAADHVRTEIYNHIAKNDRDIWKANPNKLDPSRAIIIAHSQGGLVAREMMRLDMVDLIGKQSTTLIDGMNYGGVVTVASSLQGAWILGKRKAILHILSDACNDLTAGPVYDTIQGIKPPILKNTVQNMVKNVLEGVVETVCDNVPALAKNIFFKSYYDGITNDYIIKVNGSVILPDKSNVVVAPKIDELNTQTNPTLKAFPKMAFYAREPQSQIFWRTLNWIGQLSKEPNDVAAFTANDDWNLYDTYAPKMFTYSDRVNYYTSEYNRVNTWWNRTFNESKITKADNGRYAWQRGYDWFLKINECWEEVIGARKLILVPHPNYNPSKPAGPSNPQHITAWEMHPQNDGIVLAESASNLPDATHRPVEIYNSSHMQVRNSEGLREHLNKLFNGDYYWWFRVEKY